MPKTYNDHDFDDMNRPLEKLINLQKQIIVLASTGKVTLARVRYATADKFYDEEIKATIAYLKKLGILPTTVRG